MPGDPSRWIRTDFFFLVWNFLFTREVEEKMAVTEEKLKELVQRIRQKEAMSMCVEQETKSSNIWPEPIQN